MEYIYHNVDGTVMTDSSEIVNSTFRYETSIKENVSPIDNVTKFAYDDDDYEYHAYKIQNESNSHEFSSVSEDLSDIREAICELYELYEQVSDEAHAAYIAGVTTYI